MKIVELWHFIRENDAFFRKLTLDSDIIIDFKNEMFSIGDGMYADPFMLITKSFRTKFNKSGPSKDHEFTRMNKLLYPTGTKLPMARKEYDEYINFEEKNQLILYVIEEHMGAKNNTFTIPTKEYANKLYKNVSDNIEKVLSDMFIYSGRVARYYVDIYDRLSGFEVYLNEALCISQ